MRLEAQKLKHGAVVVEAKGLREVAKQAAEAGGDNVAETEQRAFAKETEADIEKALVEALESQRAELESDASRKARGPSSGTALSEGQQLGRDEGPRLEPQVPCGAWEHSDGGASCSGAW